AVKTNVLSHTGNVSDHVAASTKVTIDSVLSLLKETSSEPDVVPDVGTSLAQLEQQAEVVQESPAEKSESNLADEEGKSQDKVATDKEAELSGDAAINSQPEEIEKVIPDIVDVDDSNSTEQPLNKTFGGISKRLRSGSGKVVPSASKTLQLERKLLDVPNIVPSTAKKFAGKKIPHNVAEVPIDKVSFHFHGNAQRWKFIFNRRLALERELGKEALECEDIVDLIKEAGLMKTVWGIGDCYEKLVKEFLV
ncbi:envelope-like protein, partial [Trifolium medium]|nr:envelope-like protein [Trifolium medium]